MLDSSPRRRQAGESTALNLLLIFTLAVLVTAFALPAYRNFTLHEHAKLARLALEEAASRYHAWQNVHPGRRPVNLADLGFDSVSIYVSSDGTITDSANIGSIYRISLSTPETPSPESCGLAVGGAPTAFILSAEPIQTQRIETRCGRLCLGSDGQKAHSGSAALEQCWAQ